MRKYTRMIFRAFPDGAVIALIPGVPANRGFVMSYMHVGQHSEADPGIVHRTRLATPKQRAPLARELRGIYGPIRIGKRLTRRDCNV